MFALVNPGGNNKWDMGPFDGLYLFREPKGGGAFDRSKNLTSLDNEAHDFLLTKNVDEAWTFATREKAEGAAEMFRRFTVWSSTKVVEIKDGADRITVS